MTTQWQWRLYLIIPASAVTPQLRTQIAQRYSDHDSGEMEASEDIGPKAIRLSLTGITPVVAYAVNTAAKNTMRDALRTLIEAVPAARVWVVANVNVDDRLEGHLVATNTQHGVVGQQWTFQQALSAFGLQPIVTAIAG